MEIKLLSGALGAEIRGIDLTDVSDENFKKINDLLLEHKVIFFRDQPITKDQQIALAEKFGPLEIKVLKCAKVKVNNKIDDAAYMQVKDLTKNENDKVFIFNGWTFASDPSLTPFDHAIYDLQLLNCYSA